MTFVYFILIVASLSATAALSWKLALHWHARTRDARAEDPRDQEIREMGAALSIARKELARLTAEQQKLCSEATELRDKLDHSGEAMANAQEKYNATKQHLEKESAAHADLNELVAQLRRELEQAQARTTELEVQARLAANEQTMLADEELISDNNSNTNELDEAQARIQQLQAELKRWKQHCRVLSTSNKELRNQALKTAAIH